MIKKTVFLFGVLAVIFSFIACDSKKSDGMAEGDVTIEFFQMKNEGSDYYAAIIEEFQKEYPNITVEHTNVPNAETVLLTRLSSGNVPDVFTHWSLSPSFRGLVDAGFVMDITDSKTLDNVDPAILEASLIDKKAYSVPMSLNMLGIYYNKDIFEEAGITKLPSTMDELYAICEILLGKGITPFVFADKDVWTVSQFVDRGSVAMLENPVQLFEDIASKKVIASNSPELRKMGETIVRMRSYGQEDSMGTGYVQAISDFASGNAAMFFSGTFAYPEIVKSNADVNCEMFPLPSIGGENLDRVGINVDTGFAISAETEYATAAKLFVDFCTNPENAQKFSDYDGSPSSIKGVVFNNSVFANMYSDYILEGKTVGIPANSWPAGFGGENGNLAQALIDSKDVDAWLENLNQLIIDFYNN